MNLIFNNPGAIDIRGACIAGLSAKESKSPIGYFGTGLKYSIACILRWGGSITIYSGLEKYTFEAGQINFRNEDFQLVYMNGAPLGFTTEYGKNWKAWQVFRELYANARDEGGNALLSPSVPNLVEDETTIVVSGLPDLIDLYHSRNDIILPLNQRWSYESDEMQFSSAKANGIYYRGVRVEDRACLFTWNCLEELQLTEDRTLSSPFTFAARFDNFFIEHLHDVEIIMQLMMLKYEETPSVSRMVKGDDGELFERKERPIEHMFMSWFNMPHHVYERHSTEFKSACVRLYQRDPQTYKQLRPYVKSVDSTIVEDRQHVMTPREQQMFDKAKELVALFGFESEVSRLPILVQDLGGQTLGLYEHGTIYLSPKLFDQGTKQLTATLYEECYHHRSKNSDLTYNMQSDLFNIIISLNEELHKVIC